MLAKNGGTINFNNPASITATGGAAINLENTAGTTGISGVTEASILITDTVTPPANDSILFNAVNITSRKNLGVQVDGIYGQVQFQSLTIDNASAVAGNAVQVTNTVDPGDPTGTGSGRVYINGGTIVGSQDSIRLLASGDRVVNATAFTNRLDAPSNALNAIVQDAASSILLNASGNNSSTAGVPPGKFALDNSGRPQRTLFPRVHGAPTSLPSPAKDTENVQAALPHLEG